MNLQHLGLFVIRLSNNEIYSKKSENCKRILDIETNSGFIHDFASLNPNITKGHSNS